MVRGVERLQLVSGAELAPVGSLILVNPGQVHQNGSVDDAGFAYRSLYVPLPLAERCLLDVGLRAAPLPGFPEIVAFDREIFLTLRQLHLAVEVGEPLLRLQELLTVALKLYKTINIANRILSCDGGARAAGFSRIRTWRPVHGPP
jgi:hypothetical protein